MVSSAAAPRQGHGRRADTDLLAATWPSPAWPRAQHRLQNVADISAQGGESGAVVTSQGGTSTSITPPAAAAEPHMCRPGQILIRLSPLLLLLLPCAQCFASTPGDGGRVEGGGWRVEGGGVLSRLLLVHWLHATQQRSQLVQHLHLQQCGHRQCLCTLAERRNKLVYTPQHTTHYTTHVHVSVVCLRPDSGPSIHRAHLQTP